MSDAKLASDLAALRVRWFPADLDDADACTGAAARWFAVDADFDAALQQEFATLPDRALDAADGPLAHTPHGALGLVLALDQLPRNLYRDSARAFAYDAAALALAERSVERGLDADLHPLESVFLYLPFEHAEDRAAQQRCTGLFRALVDRAPDGQFDQFCNFLDYAERHQQVVDRFGRFPHRNGVLGRTPTADEHAYLAEGGEHFGGAEDEAPD